MKKRPKYHYEGRDLDGSDLFVECTDEGGSETPPAIVRSTPSEPGKPAGFGKELAEIRRVDGRHYEICPVRPCSKGPAQVTTDAYRDGWENIWGRSGVN